ncbi:biosynthetic-type acetolactate synthase large subunit [Tepidibacillus fermentans]|uniref:Acetolactate synthase n=1 Tax=Tepidibacillus fermentans TaxID=1281767 RepID=A0A4R3KKE5_9BACI|nr:biosynthetic-type acetolactate synthase large subunit [Tepidibacillus fermentans]TCS83190.1 acetolactate synthase large subunit [Tepidibacillus fermentans]
MRAEAYQQVDNRLAEEPVYEMKSGAEMIIECLKREGVDVIFGYPGGAVIPIYDALYDSGLKHVLSRHEQGAIHAADGYARSTGKVGVVIGTSGPGATNLVTGITNAYMDSIPLVVLTGQVPTSYIGTDAFQEADITGITMPITKHNYLVQRTQDLPKILKEAFYIARSGRPGPVLIDIPKDISYDVAPFYYPESVSIPSYQPTIEPNPSQVMKVAKTIEQAKRPLILAGGGVISSGAETELLQFVEKMQIPVTTTLMGLGGFPASHPLWLGMPGMHGTVTANRAIQNADLLISLGARFDDRVTGKIERFAPKAKIVHVDIDPAEVGKIIPTQLPLVGDIKHVLVQLMKKTSPGDTIEWIEQLQQWKKEKPLRYKDSKDGIKAQYVIEQLSNYTKGDAIISTDVGQHQMWTAQYYKFEKARTLLTSGGLGTMGFGLPAAVGAQVGHPDQKVVCISGDGSIQMNIQELATIVQQKLPLKIIILNNSYLGMVRQWQQIFHDCRYSCTFMTGPDFVKLAEAYGMLGIRAVKKEEVTEVLEQGMKHNGPVIMEFMVEEEENVFPFVPPGASLDEMIEGE